MPEPSFLLLNGVDRDLPLSLANGNPDVRMKDLIIIEWGTLEWETTFGTMVESNKQICLIHQNFKYT